MTRRPRTASPGPRAGALACLAAVLVVCLGCNGSVVGPDARAIATFGVGGETFRAELVSDEQIRAAEAAQDGGLARIPNGRIVAGTGVNTGWSWHLEDIEFAEVTVEVCDGLPSHVEREGTSFGNGRYCPWGARVLRIDRTN
ncbi:MAG: hypothetical protein AB7G23_15880 [Vicinamibacterales bacterium]